MDNSLQPSPELGWLGRRYGEGTQLAQPVRRLHFSALGEKRQHSSWICIHHLVSQSHKHDFHRIPLTIKLHTMAVQWNRKKLLKHGRNDESHPVLPWLSHLHFGANCFMENCVQPVACGSTEADVDRLWVILTKTLAQRFNWGPALGTASSTLLACPLLEILLKLITSIFFLFFFFFSASELEEKVLIGSLAGRILASWFSWCLGPVLGSGLDGLTPSC